jgi:hypothetical protein
MQERAGCDRQGGELAPRHEEVWHKA